MKKGGDEVLRPSVSMWRTAKGWYSVSIRGRFGGTKSSVGGTFKREREALAFVKQKRRAFMRFAREMGAES